MTSVSYAPTGSGPYANAIGWINFPTTPLPPNSAIMITNTLRDGSTISFTLRNSSSTNSESFIGVNAPANAISPFGTAGYNGVSGPVIFYSMQLTNFNNYIQFDNIVVKDPQGKEITNYTIVLADGETTDPGESIKYTTNGGSWTTLGNIGSGTSPQYTGLGTNTVTSTGISYTYHSYILATASPKNISINLSSYGGKQGIAFGVILTGIRLNKIINNRAYPNDQFELSIQGYLGTSTYTTTGNLSGLQLGPSMYITLDSISTSSFVINESMATGSSGSLSYDYLTTVKNSNLTPNGTPVSSNGFLGETINLKLGDYVLTTITNTAISPLKIEKESCNCSACLGEKIPYTIKVTNQSNTVVNNIVIEDVIPLGTYVSSVTVSIGSISEYNEKLVWTIPSLQAQSSGIAMTIMIATEKVCFDNRGYIINTSKIVSYNSISPLNPLSDTVITSIDCFGCNCKE